MRHLMRLSVGPLAGVALFLAGCGHASSPPPKPAPSPTVALHLSAGPVVAAPNGEFKVVLTATGQQVGKTYSLLAIGAVYSHVGIPSLGAREGRSWTVEYAEEGTSGQTRFSLSGPLPALAGPGPSAAPPASNTVVVKW